MDDQDIISRVALAIKRAYCMQRCLAQRIDSYNPPDEKYQKIWTAAALICIRNQINPFSFIEVQFATMKPFPELSQIASEAALQRYRGNAGAHALRYAQEFSLQIGDFERLSQIYGDALKVLLDPSNCFDPLFIYVTASVLGYSDTVKKYEEDAFAKYLTSVHYDQVYKDAIPEHFKTRADNIRGAWYATKKLD